MTDTEIFDLRAGVEAYRLVTGDRVLDQAALEFANNGLRRALGEVERLRGERDTLKAACRNHRRRWRRGTGSTLDALHRGWVRAAAEAQAEVERLRTIVARLPHTADGVPVTGRCTLWFRALGMVYAREYVPSDPVLCGWFGILPLSHFYSTQEAAEAAKEQW